MEYKISTFCSIYYHFFLNFNCNALFHQIYMYYLSVLFNCICFFDYSNHKVYSCTNFLIWSYSYVTPFWKSMRGSFERVRFFSTSLAWSNSVSPIAYLLQNPSCHLRFDLIGRKRVQDLIKVPNKSLYYDRFTSKSDTFIIFLNIWFANEHFF